MSLPVVAIVGRPNVGKSTLFNRIIGWKKAVVHDRPGVTRDRLYETATLVGRRVLLVDTGGIEPAPDTSLLEAMRRQAMVAVEEADAILFVVDGQAGYTPADAEVADLLRRGRRPVLLVVNKVDGQGHELLASDFWTVGFPSLHTVSAAHGRGLFELLDELEQLLPNAPPEADAFAEEAEAAEVDAETLEAEAAGQLEDGASLARSQDQRPEVLRIAVIGRPNIGKSTLVNRLLGYERQLVHDAPGTTTDPVDTELEIEGRRYVLVDTAGVRKKAKIDDPLERFISLRSIRAIERCHVCLLLIDATVGPSEQDARLAALTEDRGRGLMILVNKWDLTKDLPDVDSRGIEEALADKLPHARWAPPLFLSALTGKGCHRILPMVEDVFTEFNRRVSTPTFNRWLKATVERHTPPQRHHHPVRIHYGVQSRVRPPTFTLFSNTPDGVTVDYRRFLVNQLRDQWGFRGTPIRLHVKRKRQLGD
jgi:GTP-binding protein